MQVPTGVDGETHRDRERPFGGGYGERAVGRHQPDPGAPVEQVVDVGGALVGDAEQQLGERHRHAVGDRREQLVVRRAR